MAPIKALAVDIDGTLSDKNRVLCPRAVQALRRLDLPVVLSTGNTHCFTRTVSVLLGTPRLLICENGGVISLSEEEMEILADIKICEEAFVKLSGEFHLSRYNSSRYRFSDIALLRNFDTDAASRRAQDLGLPVEFIDTGFAVHIKDRRVDKGTGLYRIATKMKIDLTSFAAIGDSKSDLPMFRLVGYSASVGNASPELKEISDYVAEARYGDGFAEIIEHMIKEKLI